ncbi:MAG: glycosyltransferase family 2 protein [Candidatus Bathyarchaeia archaeon]
MAPVSLSVIIPVYKESALLETVLAKLLEDKYQPKEIIVTIDEPTEKSRDLARKMRGQVKFHLNPQRLGKAVALNQAVKDSSGEILFFLDGDVDIKDQDHNFLSVLVEEMRDTDLLDIRKGVIRQSFLSRLISYDFLVINMTNWIYSRSGRALGINGSAFAVKRQVFDKLGGFKAVLSEDMDFTMRCFLADCRFKFTNKIEVLNEVPNTWKAWYAQRMRWAIGSLLWFKDYYKEIGKSLVKYPIFLLPLIIVCTPSIIFTVSYLLTYNLLYGALTILLLPFSPILAGVTLLVKWAIAFVIYITGFGVSSSLFKVISAKLRYLYYFAEYVVYFFVYSPLLLAVTLIGFIHLILRYENIVETQVRWEI